MTASAVVPLQFVPGGMELLMILLLVVLLFGASKLPEVARSIGKSTGEFRKGRQELREELEEMDEE